MEPGLGLDSALNSVKHDEFNKFDAVTSENRRGGEEGDYSKSGGRSPTKQAPAATPEPGREPQDPNQIPEKRIFGVNESLTLAHGDSILPSEANLDGEILAPDPL